MRQTLQPPPPLETLRRRHASLRDKTTPAKQQLGWSDKLAVWITTRVGTMGFFLLIFGWTVCWLGWNLLAPPALQFDKPMEFAVWLFISNLIQILLMPLIMVGQNIQGRFADERAQHDLEVNIKAEDEIEMVLRHLEYQNTLLLELMRRAEARSEARSPD